jgi:hypothetical protein
LADDFMRFDRYWRYIFVHCRIYLCLSEKNGDGGSYLKYIQKGGYGLVGEMPRS